MAGETRPHLLARLRTDEAGAWREFIQQYTPFLQRVAERSGLRGQDIDEVVQNVIVDLYKGRSSFLYDRGRGRFRAYLKKAVLTRLSKMLREIRRAGIPTESVPDEGSFDVLERNWDQEYDDHVVREALKAVRSQVEPKTYQAFDLYALQKIEVSEVARFLGVSPAAVYTYKNRVMQKVKAIVQELVDD